MSGYNGFSKSNNAVEAEAAGMLTAGRMARRLGVSVAALAAVAPANEWHHTSKMFSRTEYYNPARFVVVADDGGNDDGENVAEMLAVMGSLTAESRSEENLGLCQVTYLEWPAGVGRGRSHRPTEIVIRDVEVTQKGQFYHFNGMKKKITSNGTEVTSMSKVLAAEKAATKRAERWALMSKIQRTAATARNSHDWSVADARAIVVAAMEDGEWDFAADRALRAAAHKSGIWTTTNPA